MKRKRFDDDDDLPTAIGPRHKIFVSDSIFQKESVDHLCKALEERLVLCSSSEVNNCDPVLESRHKIFLSHSGVQKEFVDHLCKALEERDRYPFFDRRNDSLPKGEKFPGLIIKAAQQCQLLVVVVSEEYFMSKWPMIELNAFVKAREELKSKKNHGILPLFYRLSVNELKDEKRRQRWFEKWETFARKDSLIKVDDWKFALGKLTKFNGLSYNQKSKQAMEFEKEIVSRICGFVPSNVKFEDSQVQGNAHKDVMETMEQVGVLKSNKVRVVGLYGMGGIGKTTTCKKLCNELSNEFDGRVCHIEFDGTSSNFKKLLEKVLMQWRSISGEDIQTWDESKCEHALCQNLVKQKTFLAIDNVWDNGDSIKHAMMFLQAPSHPDSLILVTARCQRTLELLRVDKVAHLEMPELGQGDARNLFLHYAANGQQFTSEEDMASIGICIRRCYFSKGDGDSSHYHPLALEVLGRQLGSLGKNPVEWKGKLPLVLDFNGFSGENEVFGVLRSSFDLLPPNEKDLFMDVAIFLHHLYEDRDWFLNPMLWLKRLCTQYEQDEKQMQSLLESLKGKGLLQDVNLSSGKVSMHDLYHEFAMLEAKGKLLEEESIENQRWVYVDVRDGGTSKLKVTPYGQCWLKLTRLSIFEDDVELINGSSKWITHPIESLSSIEWKYFPNVLVLQLYGLKSVKGTLNLDGMECLQSLQIYGLSFIERLEGLEGLTNLTLFEWSSSPYCCSQKPILIVGQLPRSLLHVDIHGKCVLSGLDVFAQCNKLCKLLLVEVEVGIQLDLSNCSSLENVLLSQIQDLQTFLLPSVETTFRLLSLHVELCFNLVDVQGLDQLDCLQSVCLASKNLWKWPYLKAQYRLIATTIYNTKDFGRRHFPPRLQESYYIPYQGSIKAPNLNGLNQLQGLDLSRSDTLTCMSKMEDLPALRSLNFRKWFRLRWLPNFSNRRSLRNLTSTNFIT